MTAKQLADRLAGFLEKVGDAFLSWQDGCIVVSTYHDKQFRALGGDTHRLISFFEDYCNMDEAGRKYIERLYSINTPDHEMPTTKEEPRCHAVGRKAEGKVRNSAPVATAEQPGEIRPPAVGSSLCKQRASCYEINGL